MELRHKGIWLSVTLDQLSAFFIYFSLAAPMFACDSSSFFVDYSISSIEKGAGTILTPLNSSQDKCAVADKSFSTLITISYIFKVLSLASVIILELSSLHYILILYVRTRSFLTLSYSHTTASIAYLLVSFPYILFLIIIKVDLKVGLYLTIMCSTFMIARIFFYNHLKKQKNWGIDVLRYGSLEERKEEESHYSVESEKVEDKYKSLYEKSLAEKKEMENRILSLNNTKAAQEKEMSQQIKSLEKSYKDKLDLIEEEKKKSEHLAFARGMESIQGEINARLEEKFLLGLEKGKVSVRAELEEQMKKNEESLYSRAFHEAERKFQTKLMELETTFKMNKSDENQELVDQLQGKISEASRENKELSDSLIALKQEINYFKPVHEKNEVLNRELSQVKAEIKAANDELQRFKKLADDEKIANGNLREEVMRLKQMNSQSFESENKKNDDLKTNQEKISKIITENQNLIEKLEEKENQVRQASKETEILIEQLNKKELEIKESKDLITGLTSEKDSLSSQVNILKEDLHKINEHNIQIKEQLTINPYQEEVSNLSIQLSQKVQDLNESNLKLSQQLIQESNLKNQLQEKTQEIEVLNKIISDNSSKISTLTSQLESQNSDTSLLFQSKSQELESIQAKLDSSLSHSEILEQDLKTKSNELQESAQKIHLLDHEIVELKASLSSFNDLNSSLMKQNEEKSDELKSYVEQIAGLEKNLLGHNSRIEELEESLSKFKLIESSFEILKVEHLDLISKLKGSEDSLDLASSTLAELRSQVDERNKVIHDLEGKLHQEMQDAKLLNTQLQEKLNTSETSLSALKSSLDSKEAELSSLNLSLASLQSQFRSLDEEKKEITSNLSQLLYEKQSLQTDLEEKEQALLTISKKLAEVTKSSKESESNLSSLLQELMQSQSKTSDLESELESKSKQIKDLTAQNSELSSKLQSS